MTQISWKYSHLKGPAHIQLTTLISDERVLPPTEILQSASSRQSL